MKIINWEEFQKNEPLIGSSMEKTSMTVGIFDGVHRGHQVLIKKIVSYNKNYLPAVITFRQNHKTAGNEQKDIQTFQQRLLMLENLGIKLTVVVDFTETFMEMPGFEFLEILLKYGNVGFFAAGSDFRCGRALDTNASIIKTFFNSRNIPVEILPNVMEGSQPVSSSRIRKAIADNDITLAQTMLK